MFGCVIVRSLTNKVDDLLSLLQEQSIDVTLLTETWHDADSISIRRFRTEGFNVIERPRPWVHDSTLRTNHGGVAVIAVAQNVARVEHVLSKVDLGAVPTTFEHLCVRVTSGLSSCVVLLLYRSGSVSVTNEFFTDLSDVLDRLVTFADPVIIAGDQGRHLGGGASQRFAIFSCKSYL